MKVNIDGLRRNLVNSLASLTKKLNRSIQIDDDDGEKMIVIDPDDIRREIDALQSMVGGLCCIFEPGDEMFTDMGDYAHDNLPDFDPIKEGEEGYEGD